MESNKHNLKQYKQAKELLPRLNAVIQVIDLSIKGLTHFSYYMPVYKILYVMKEQREILVFHQKKYSEILKNKGKETL